MDRKRSRFGPAVLALVLVFPAAGVLATPPEDAPPDNPELQKMYEEDQGDRSKPHGEIDWKVVSERDRQHRKRVKELLAAWEVQTANDYYHAAMVFQHGTKPEAAQRAHELAKKAIALDPNHKYARWLSAAAWDRYKMYLGEAQWYGTQFSRNEKGVWILYNIDEDAVTDEERVALGVPTLEESRQRAVAMNTPKR